MVKEPTREQQLIIDHPGNTVVTAKPGSGKTYTVVEKISKVLTSLPDYKGVIAISFTILLISWSDILCSGRGATTITISPRGGVIFINSAG